MAMIGHIWLSPAMVDEVSIATGKHRTTVARWLSRGQIPRADYRLLDLLYNGQLGQLHDAWAGYQVDVRHGELVTPVGTTITPGELLAIPYRRHQLAHLQRKAQDSNAAENPVDARVQRL